MSREIVFTGQKGGLTLAGKMKKGLAEIREEKNIMKAAEGIILLLDVSGSMKEKVGERRKIDHLREAIVNHASLRKVSFSRSVVEGLPEHPEFGGTHLAHAFDYLLSSRPKTVILISDGLPDSREDAFSAAEKLGCPINIVYIGPGEDEGEAFMKELAQRTRGKQVTADTCSAKADFGKQLTNKVQLLLPQKS